MKKTITILLALAMVLALAACGQEKAPSEGPVAPPVPENENGELPAPSEPQTPEGGNDQAGSGEPTAPSEPQLPTESPVSGTPVFPVPGTPSVGGEDGGSDTPSIVPGSPPIAVPGQGGDTEDIPVADAGDLVDKLDSLCDGIVSDSCFTESLRSSGSFSNYFGGKVAYVEGTRVAVNVPAINIDKHIAMLIEVPEGEDAQAYAENLLANADPNWTICGGPAESVQCAAKDGLVLFVMSSAGIADSLIAAFNA